MTRTGRPNPAYPAVRKNADFLLDYDRQVDANEVRAIVKATGLSLSSFARACGVDVSLLSRILVGERRLTPNTRRLMARAKATIHLWR